MSEQRRLTQAGDTERFRLTIPLDDAFAMAMGWSDLECTGITDSIRQVIGLFVIDGLEYDEQWRTAARVRQELEQKWPGLIY